MDPHSHARELTDRVIDALTNVTEHTTNGMRVRQEHKAAFSALSRQASDACRASAAAFEARAMRLHDELANMPPDPEEQGDAEGNWPRRCGFFSIPVANLIEARWPAGHSLLRQFEK